MEFPAVTYGAGPVDFSIGAAHPDSLPNSLPNSAPHIGDGLAAFLLRVAAYFQGCLASFPRAHSSYEEPSYEESSYEQSAHQLPAPQPSLTVIDTALDGSDEPLIKVRMNRALSRRMRWLVRRGRVKGSGRLRVYNPEAESRCNLTPGQMIEYCIRVYRESRAAAYGLNRGGRIVNRGCVLSLGLALLCNAILTPD